MIHSETFFYIFVFVLLTIATAIAALLRNHPLASSKPDLVEEIGTRIKAWWLMIVILFAALALGHWAVKLLFFCISIAALREYRRLTEPSPSRFPAGTTLHDRVLPIAAAAQYLFLGTGGAAASSALVPAGACIAIGIHGAVREKRDSFLSNAAEAFWGLTLFVILLSHAPALLTLRLENSAHTMSILLCFLIFITESNDILQFIFGKRFGRRKIAPEISPNKTLEGFLGGAAGSMLLGALLAPLTPFGTFQAALAGLIIAVAGFFGGLTMSAMKRDRGVKDFGTLIAGHGGIVDRIDSLCFSAPVFFYLVEYCFGAA